jgi:hypothetical protein
MKDIVFFIYLSPRNKTLKFTSVKSVEELERRVDDLTKELKVLKRDMKQKNNDNHCNQEFYDCKNHQTKFFCEHCNKEFESRNVSFKKIGLNLKLSHLTFLKIYQISFWRDSCLYKIW